MSMAASEQPPHEPWILQLCHGYDGPFLDCARQYASLFSNTRYKVCTVYLTGAPSEGVVAASASSEVIFFDYSSKQLRGLKLRPIAELRKLLSTRKFMLCIAHRFKPAYVALLGSQLPVIAVHHGFGDYKRLGRRAFAQVFHSRLSLLAVSNAVRDEIRACLPRWAAEKIQTLYNRVDLEELQAEQLDRGLAREQLGLPTDAWVVANVGRLHPDKDQATLIRGFAKAKDALPENSLLVILGQGRLERDLKQLAESLGVANQVRFVGQVPLARRFFKAFDVFVLSSDHEPFGMVLLEAMAAGVPVIVSDCGGGPEVVGSLGIRFPHANAEALAQSLLHTQTMSASAIDEYRSSARERVSQMFSDASASASFWGLPSVKNLSMQGHP